MEVPLRLFFDSVLLFSCSSHDHGYSPLTARIRSLMTISLWQAGR